MNRRDFPVNGDQRPGLIRFAGKDTAESQAWDGSMSFDNVYSEKHVLKDTASNVVLAG